MFTLVFAAISNKVWAYQNSSYYSDLKVQLKSMSTSTMTLTLNGEYKMNGNILPSGTILNIESEAAQLHVDGIVYTEIQLIPENSSNTISLYNDTRALSYLGTLILKSEASKIMPYNILDIENYLKGVVPYEMSEYYPLEALKAQAVAARNYALIKIGTKASLGYDFDDTVSFQVYGGYNPNYVNTIKAVDDTRGMVLLNNSVLVETLYSASHGGYTEASENVWGNYTDYLRSKPDAFENELWPNGDIFLSSQQIGDILKIKGYLKFEDSFVKIDIASITRFESSRINSLPIIYKDEAGAELTKYITKDSARTFLSLPSSMYSVVYNELTGMYTFSGKGYGHGLGMSQIGAKNRAQAGQAFEEILKFYYDGTYLETIPSQAIDPVPGETDSGTGDGTGGEAETPGANNQTPQSDIPEVKLLTQPNAKYKPGETISLSVASPNYSEKVEYRVIIYNGTTKVSTQFYNSPATGFYNTSGQQAGNSNYLINIPVKNTTAGPYSITILARKAGTSVPYDSFVNTNSFTVEALTTPSIGGTVSSNVPKLTMITPPSKEYYPGDTISLTISSPNYGGKVEYRVILYNGTTKTTSELWMTPKTGYYYKNWQPSGNYNFNIHWPVTGMKPGPYSITVLVRRVGAKVPYDSFVKTEAIWIRN
ncbi:MAG: SpoIID/LytB domain protein [Clostridiales bacterium]|nr:SpoIID/LytB domain protein [Clostridiales bacterium]